MTIRYLLLCCHTVWACIRGITNLLYKGLCFIAGSGGIGSDMPSAQLQHQKRRGEMNDTVNVPLPNVPLSASDPVPSVPHPLGAQLPGFSSGNVQ